MKEIVDVIIEFIKNSGPSGALLGCGFIVIESILPVLPLMFFITINFLAFGHFFGFLISWLFTIMGCIFSYMIFRNGFGNKYNKYIRDKDNLVTLTKNIKNISFTNLVLILSLPFTPAFLVNIAAGLSKMRFIKFFFSILIGKIALVYFWGFIGTSFVDSLSNPLILLKIVFIMFIMYLISLYVNKKFKID